MLVVGGIHIGTQLVGGLPELLSSSFRNCCSALFMKILEVDRSESAKMPYRKFSFGMQFAK